MADLGAPLEESMAASSGGIVSTTRNRKCCSRFINGNEIQKQQRKRTEGSKRLRKDWLTG